MSAHCAWQKINMKRNMCHSGLDPESRIRKIKTWILNRTPGYTLLQSNSPKVQNDNRKEIASLFVFLSLFLFSYTAHAEEIPQIPLEDKVDQMLMIGFRGMDVTPSSDIEKILKETHVGGVILFDYDTTTKTYNRNIQNKKQLQTLTKNLQSKAQENGIPKLFVAIDQEGGLVNRLKPGYGFPVFNSAQVVFSMGYIFAQTQYTRLANELASVGVNVNFGPVLDVTTNPQSTIYKQKRMYSKNAISVSQFARVFIDALSTKKILSVGKHYPGLGDLVFDTHTLLGQVKTRSTLGLYPYKQLITEKKLQAVMMGHIRVTDVDPVYPASLSSQHIDYLRNILGFDGIIFTDDLEMKGLSSLYTLKERVVYAVNAGNTVLIFSNNMGNYNPDLFFKVRTIVMDGVKDGTIDVKKIDDAYRRIIEAKARL